MKTTLVAGVVVAILVLVGILAIFLSVGKHSVTTPSNTLPPVSLPSTSTTTTQSSSITTVQSSTTTSTTTTTTTQSSTITPSKLQPDALYLLNYTNGTYWFVAVLNVTLPGYPLDAVLASSNYAVNVLTIYKYHLYGYTELVFSLNAVTENKLMNGTTDESVFFMSVLLSSDEVEDFTFKYAGNWTFGSI